MKKIFWLGLFIFLSILPSLAQGCGQVIDVELTPQSFINDTVQTVTWNPPVGPPVLAYGIVTVTAQGCAADPINS